MQCLAVKPRGFPVQKVLGSVVPLYVGSYSQSPSLSPRVAEDVRKLFVVFLWLPHPSKGPFSPIPVPCVRLTTPDGLWAFLKGYQGAVTESVFHAFM